MKKSGVALLCLALLLSAAGCAITNSEKDTPFPSVREPDGVSFDVDPQVGKADSEANTVIFFETGVSSYGTGFTVEGTTVTVTSAGTYLFCGTCSNGQIIVDTADEEKVVLKLNGLSLGCQNDAPVYVRNCPKKTVLQTCEESVNLLWDTTSERTADAVTGDVCNACVYAREDLCFKGKGTLYVQGAYGKGIMTKDDLTLESGTLYVQATDDGLRGRDSITVTGGTLYVDAGGDGLRTSNTENEAKGSVEISGGDLTVVCDRDAIQAVADVTVTGGTVTVKTGGGSAAAKNKTETNPGVPGGMGGPGIPGGPGGWGPTERDDDTTSTISAKGIKAAKNVCVTGGDLSLDTLDDGLHANGNMTVAGGVLTVSSGDDGLHADGSLTVTGGTLTVAKSYEGLEAHVITVEGGTVLVTSSDDGLNANGGDGSGQGRPGQGSFIQTDDPPLITVSGGTLVLDASGDGIDSNGSIYITGGTTLVYGQTTGGNGAIDYGDTADCTCRVSGGFLLTLDVFDRAQYSRAEGDGQTVFVVSLGKTLAEGTLLHVEDTDGNTVATVQTKKRCDMLVLSSPALQSGTTYRFYSGGTDTGTETYGLFSGGTYTGGTLLGELTAE